MYITVSTACKECGGQFAVRATTEEPTEDQISENVKAAGSMHCISTIVTRVTLDEPPVCTWV